LESGKGEKITAVQEQRPKNKDQRTEKSDRSRRSKKITGEG
jgi:hypothetical protein